MKGLVNSLQFRGGAVLLQEQLWKMTKYPEETVERQATGDWLHIN